MRDYLDFVHQQVTSRGNYFRVWFFVDAAFAARFPLEMLDDVSDISFLAINACFFKCFVEQFAGRTNKRLAFEVFIVAGLLADEENFSLASAGAKDGLRAALIKVAGLAIGRGFAKCRQRFSIGNQIFGVF